MAGRVKALGGGKVTVPPKQRTFGGLVYEIDSGHNKMSNARQCAEELRRRGYSARVVKGLWTSVYTSAVSTYIVYKRPRKVR